MADQISNLLEHASLEDNDPPKTILKKMLSVRSVVSTSSSFAMRNQEASSDPSLQQFSEIGQGNCGHVFSQLGTAQVVKRAREDGPESPALWNDFLMHKKVEQGFEVGNSAGLPTVHIPRPILYISRNDKTWWDNNAYRFPNDVQLPSNLLMSERILPLPKVIRDALIQLYCPEHLRSAQLVEPKNKDCLVRVYLGKNSEVRQLSQRPPMFFSLRNFKLHLNQMKDLGLDVATFATTMANALAILHWQVKIDAADVEFVLGSAPTESHVRAPSHAELKKMDPDSSTYVIGGGLTFHQRVVHLWLLDFNQCKEIEMNDMGVAAAVEAFALNDRYYPRPSVDKNLWRVFFRDLPKKFIKNVVVEMERRAGRY
ncbi:hypothetical protein DL98DRAFT_550626 [Cadophora sp. DSE1049]|nr:hypothetical protein DL98DRAFT_550626 [Cadophora sp. DSE1049]